MSDFSVEHERENYIGKDHTYLFKILEMNCFLESSQVHRHTLRRGGLTEGFQARK